MPSSYSVLEDISDSTPTVKTVDTEGGADSEILFLCLCCEIVLLLTTDEEGDTKEAGDDKMETDEKTSKEVSGLCVFTVTLTIIYYIVVV